MICMFIALERWFSSYMDYIVRVLSGDWQTMDTVRSGGQTLEIFLERARGDFFK